MSPSATPPLAVRLRPGEAALLHCVKFFHTYDDCAGGFRQLFNMKCPLCPHNNTHTLHSHSGEWIKTISAPATSNPPPPTSQMVLFPRPCKSDFCFIPKVFEAQNQFGMEMEMEMVWRCAPTITFPISSCQCLFWVWVWVWVCVILHVVNAKVSTIRGSK